jgi:hypothetical protein
MALELEKKGRSPVGGEIRMSAPEERVIIESPEEAEEQVAEMQGEAEAPAPTVPTATAERVSEPVAESAAPVAKDWKVAEIEGLLSEDLRDLYKAMPPAKQKAFRERGEKLAAEIARELPRAKPEQVFKQVRSWLKMIPATNPYYLEQEAKIKTDRLFLLS